MVIIIEINCQNVKSDCKNGIIRLLALNNSRQRDMLTGSEGELIIAVTYKKLFHLMIDKGITNAELMEKAGFSANIITRLKRNNYLSLDTIEKYARH